MADCAKIDVTYASDVIRDDFFAEFYCNGEQWGEMAFHPGTMAYEQAYTLTLFPAQSSTPIVVSVGELERVLQIAKWRITPISSED